MSLGGLGFWLLGLWAFFRFRVGPGLGWGLRLGVDIMRLAVLGFSGLGLGKW